MKLSTEVLFIHTQVNRTIFHGINSIMVLKINIDIAERGGTRESLIYPRYYSRYVRGIVCNEICNARWGKSGSSTFFMSLQKAGLTEAELLCRFGASEKFELCS